MATEVCLVMLSLGLMLGNTDINISVQFQLHSRCYLTTTVHLQLPDALAAAAAAMAAAAAARRRRHGRAAGSYARKDNPHYIVIRMNKAPKARGLTRTDSRMTCLL